jgi:hypothetical protein
MRVVLDSSERAALAAFDDEVNRVVKRCEIEGESVEVLLQQLSAKIVAGIDGSPDRGDNSMLASSYSSVYSVDVAVNNDGLEELLRSCWSVVLCDSDEPAVAAVNEERRICSTVRMLLVSCPCLLSLQNSVMSFAILQLTSLLSRMATALETIRSSAEDKFVTTWVAVGPCNPTLLVSLFTVRMLTWTNRPWFKLCWFPE